MKAILEFNLPEDSEEHTAALNGRSYLCALDDVRDILRRYRKYEELNKVESAFLEKISEEIHGAINDRVND